MYVIYIQSRHAFYLYRRLLFIQELKDYEFHHISYLHFRVLFTHEKKDQCLKFNVLDIQLKII